MPEHPRMTTVRRWAVPLLLTAIVSVAVLLAAPSSALVAPSPSAGGSAVALDEQPPTTQVGERSRRSVAPVPHRHAQVSAPASIDDLVLPRPASEPVAEPAFVVGGPGPPRGPPLGR